MNSRVEILAPAGSMESMMAAVQAGADAIYMGGSRFGARAYADNPEEDRFLEAIDYVHLHGCRLYMTVNTLVKEEEPDVLQALFPAPVPDSVPADNHSQCIQIYLPETDSAHAAFPSVSGYRSG